MNTPAACHTAQDITWMYAADKNVNCMQHHKTHVNRRARGWANSRPHTHTMRTWSASVRTPTRNRNSRPEWRDPNTKLQHETRHADERAHGSSTLEAACSRENRTWWCHGFVTKLMNDTRPKWQNPDTTCLLTLRVHCYVRFRVTFTFMHLADAFIQSDLQCIQAIQFFVSMCVKGNRINLHMLAKFLIVSMLYVKDSSKYSVGRY